MIKLSYNYKADGVHRSRDMRSIDEILKGYSLIPSDNNAARIYIKDNAYSNDIVREIRCYVLVQSMGEAVLIAIEPYDIGKDRFDVRHYSYTDNLFCFMKDYGGLLLVFKLIVDKLR